MLPAAGDAAGAEAAGAGEDKANARTAPLQYGRGVLAAGEDEADAPPCWQVEAPRLEVL